MKIQLYLERSFLSSFSKGFYITKFAQLIYEYILLAKKQNIQDKAKDFFDHHFPSWWLSPAFSTVNQHYSLNCVSFRLCVCVCVCVCVSSYTHTHKVKRLLVICHNFNFLYLWFFFFFFFLAKNMYYLGNLENTCFKFHSFKYPEVVSPGISFYALVEKPSMPGFFSQTWDEKILLPWLLGDMTPSPAEYHAQYLSTGDGACYFFIHFWKLSPRNAL